MKRMGKGVSACGLLAGLLVTAFSAAAHAESEYVMILLDATGSMTLPGMSGTRWEQAVNTAASQVSADQADPNLATKDRFYAIFSFKQDSNTGQDGLLQVWPNQTSDCTAGVQTVGTVKYCHVGSNANNYFIVSRKLNQCGGSTTCIRDDAAIKPADGGPLTPLAKSLCNSVTTLSDSVQGQNKVVILESDGNENATLLSDNCGGELGTITTNADGTLNTNTTEWGITPNSWQDKVMRRAFLPTQGEPMAAATPLQVAPNLRLPTSMAWKVDVHYSFCAPEDTVCSSGNPTSTMAFSSNTRLLSQSLSPELAGNVPVSTFLTALSSASSTTAAAAAATSAPVASLLPQELALFKGLAKMSPRGKFREFVRSANMPVFGVTHKIAGDVDDSGCVDRADYNILVQRDVWQQRAVQPLQIAIRADLNRDGWVNYDDYNVLKSTWAKGCKNPVGALPAAP